ncbi:MAG TPA: thioredoxin family protein [Desulfobacterales bacterium]|jgi:thiol:disulfide interchange protein DsbD|nr:thioredoxin family protein [Desulfobacterales bacterium]HSM91230.1 thioredoxin family protein [Desulfobacterales bacterium]
MSRVLALALVLLLVTGCWAGPDDSPAAKIQWVQDLPEGLRRAKETGKPAMLFFTADWCGPCVELKKYVFSDKRVAAASARLVNIYIDVDKNYDTLAAYKVRGIPAIFFLNPAGEVVERFSDDRSVAGFVKKMNAVADKHKR